MLRYLVAVYLAAKCHDCCIDKPVRLQKETGVAYNRMLFYDDEGMNVKRVWAIKILQSDCQVCL